MADTEVPLSIHRRLNAVQMGLKAPKGQKNNFGDYYYRSCEDILNAVKPLLRDHGLTLVISDTLEQVGDRYYVKAIATVGDGEHELSASAYAREEETKKGMDAAQITGSASSYARKYALNGLFAIDDTKDADTQDNSDHTSKPAAQPVSGDATLQQKQKIANLLEMNGVLKPDMKDWLADNYGLNHDMSSTDAAMIIDDLTSKQ